MSDYSEKWDAFDYLTVAGVVLFLGGLGSALFRTTRRGALLLPAGLACMATAAYGAPEMALLQPDLITEGRIG